MNHEKNIISLRQADRAGCIGIFIGVMFGFLAGVLTYYFTH